MPSWETLLPFFAATAVFALLPGPAILYTAAQTLAHGRRGGYLAALGIHLGGFAHVIAAAAGLSAVFTHVPIAYTVLKTVGAVYLIWLGVGIIRSKLDSSQIRAVETVSARSSASRNRTFLNSILVEVLNPKTALFFIAFLPQFADPQAALPVWLQFMVLGTIVNLAFSAADIVTVSVTDRVLAGLKKTAAARKIAKWAGGSILVGLGAHLAISK